MKYKVFIDTCIFRNMGYRFREPYSLTLDLLKSQIDLGKIELLMPITVKKEIEKHLTVNYDFLTDKLTAAIKNSSKDFPWFIDENYEIHVSSLINNNSIYDFKEFIKLYKFNILPFSYADVEKIFDQYFNNEFPFENNSKKKHEFPDAFAIDIIKNYMQDNIKDLIVITTDEGVKKSFPECVQVFSSINQLLVFLNSMVESIEDINLHLKRIKTKMEQEIIDLMQENINSMKFELSNISCANNIDQYTVSTPYLYGIDYYDLIGKENDIIYISVKVNFYVDITIYTVSSDFINEPNDNDYSYQGSETYNLTVKINGIDNYEILDISNNRYDNIIYIDYNKIEKNIYFN